MTTFASYPSPQQLWNMQPHIFNEWRANNDIPVLFAYFSTILPGFKDWIATLPFDHNVMVRIVPTGALFKGNKIKLAIERNGDFGDRVFECYEGSTEDAESYWKKRNNAATIFGSFEPYFKWAKRTLGRERFFTFDVANKSRTDRFIYGSWTGTSQPGGATSAHLFRNFTVLKLGQIVLPQGVFLAPRNLDFADLDFITVTGDWHGSYWLTMSYSSCREIKFSNAQFAFWTFHHCAMDKFACRNSKLQDFYFENSDIQEFRLTDTYVFRLGFSESRITPFIDNCELRDVTFKPAKDARPSEVATTFRLLRSAFQSMGMRREAAESYYKERVFERKAYFRPYLDDSNRRKFPGMGYTSLLSLFKTWNSGRISTSEIWPGLRMTILSHSKLWFIPKYAARLFIFRVRWFASMVECAMWGYGERPSRIFLFAFFMIGIYATIFHGADWGKNAPLKWIDSVYFSVVTFTTLGYGDILPTTTALKLLCGSEAILGAFTMGLVVAGFAGRSKY
ncbi:potassium channel family protein [Burkholderia gladioli]|uniref:potassium channel family protein n=1 Tax=Burkholderia gladioli TaxID=28095 RepID=UPI0016412B50|nr:potassium channel family protein [Burkholderia gladioli]